MRHLHGQALARFVLAISLAGLLTAACGSGGSGDSGDSGRPTQGGPTTTVNSGASATTESSMADDVTERLPGPFVGPFDGTIETLGQCVPEKRVEGEEYEGVWFPDWIFGPEGWRNVDAIDVSTALLEPDAFLTAEEAGVTIDLSRVKSPDQTELLTNAYLPIVDWLYGGELVLALADELDRGHEVQIATNSRGYVIGFSIAHDGTVRFVGNCTKGLSLDLSDMASQLSEIRGTEVTGADILTMVQQDPLGKSFDQAGREIAEANRPPTWIELHPMDRQLDWFETPREILDQLIGFELRVTLPTQWLDDPLVMCPRQELGWSRLCAAGRAAVDGVLSFDMMVEPDKPVEIWLMDGSGLDPRGPIKVIPSDELVELSNGIDVLIESTQTMADAHADADEPPPREIEG